ncbi:MAG: glycosyltransferase family 2 protein [Chloroflexi bacterium]|nr:MAG: glycosyltransferase family 2 protein [Chloroflexota bacterium]MBL1193303.1 glycosyltransferase family 2 protein [Chloroflexota bacterium]NOH10595.1 glycosyltransferase family 2 protein [Chloroflexota bacterium]
MVVPAYNEGSVIKDTLLPLIESGYSIIVVDDGSQDDTWVTLQQLPIHALRHPINRGQGAALQTAMSYALRQGAAIILHYDADGQHSPTNIPTLIQPILDGKADIVLGSRFLRPEDRQAVPAGRRFLLQIAKIVNGIMTGLWLSDAHNGARALSTEAAKQIQLQEDGFAHATEILQQMRAHKLHYVEVPTNIIYTDYSRFKGQRFWNAFDILFDLFLGRIFK